MKVFVVSYFYPDKSFAGILSVNKTQEGADSVVDTYKRTGYHDCTFTVTEVEVTD